MKALHAVRTNILTGNVSCKIQGIDWFVVDKCKQSIPIPRLNIFIKETSRNVVLANHGGCLNVLIPQVPKLHLRCLQLRQGDLDVVSIRSPQTYRSAALLAR